jgi:2-polyprenyl-3-methyl-5-hydroxy-6-metoxy-1,4-benzoquinol methylase
MSTSVPDASLPALIDRVLHACGGGSVLCLGDHAADAAAAFRHRAVAAVAGGAPAPTRGALPFRDRAFDVVYADAPLEHLDAADARQAADDIVRVARRAIVVRTRRQSRLACEEQWLAAGIRKHPLHQIAAPYQELDWVDPGSTVVFEPLPDELAVGRAVDALAAGRDLHMDMLREPGRRADAHVARYMFARRFVRSGDRVLDAACGLGYGSAILADGTFAASVLGLDLDPAAIAYARSHYGQGRARLSFDALDVAAIGTFPDASFDVVVSFETLEDVADPEAFLWACRRVLTPAGRIVGSVPNLWLDEHGRDPNPHHLHVFDRASLEAMCRKTFFIERVFGQTAGGGMKYHDAHRAIWPADVAPAADAEWWLIVGMRDPAGAGPVRHGALESRPDAPTHLLAFDRDYQAPWLVRAMVIIGQRAESAALLTELAANALATSAPGSADAGAALCVQAYRYLEHGTVPPAAFLARLSDYVARPNDIPHARRWQISLAYAAGLLALHEGDRASAATWLERCADADALAFSPHLATKTVGAAFLRGWLALQVRDVADATRWWTRGIAHAEQALRQPWDGFLLSRRRPALFGLREAAVIVDLASQCAAGLSLADHALDRPGLVASQLFESLQEQARRARLPEVAARAEPPPAPPFHWSVLAHLDALEITYGSADQVSAWDATIGGVSAGALLVHPPASVVVTIPCGAAGRLRTAMAIHPDAWGRPGAGACTFVVDADGRCAATTTLDPHAKPGDRRWVEVTMDLPASPDGTHVVTLSTRADTPAHGWALFRDLTFDAFDAAS